MQDNEKAILSLLASALFSVQHEVLDVDWNAVYGESVKQAVPAIAAQAAPVDLEGWKAASFKTIVNNMRVEQAHCLVDQILTSADIPYVILKGCASASYYPKPQYRTMGDVDFLVKLSDVSRVEELFLREGFAKSSHVSAHHHSFYKDGVSYELHFAVNGIPDGEAGRIVETYLEDTIETAQPYVLRFGRAMLPDEFHHGLIILLHTARHMISSGMGLRHLCDWAVFVDRVEDFPSMFEKPFREMGLWNFACQLTAVCTKYISLPVQPWCTKWPEELLEDMILDILGAGNFGRKRENNQESWLTSNVASGGTNDRTALGQMIYATNEVTRLHWPLAKKCSLLLPLGWFFFGGRYMLRMFFGKRKKINVPQMISVARERKELYSQFRLFEME